MTARASIRILLLLVGCLWSFTGGGGENAVGPVPLRPPSVPLIACDPYFSIWSPADKLTDSDTVHWTGQTQPLACVIKVDGQALRVMGLAPAALPALPQSHLQVTPTRTSCEFAGHGVELHFTFMTPSLPDDLSIYSRPVTYLVWEARSTDAVEHQVEVYFGASAELAVNQPSQLAEWSAIRERDLVVLKLGSRDQPVLAARGDDLRIDWGYFYVAALSSQARSASVIPAQRYWHEGKLFASREPVGAPSFGPAESLMASVALDFGKVGSSPVSRWLLLAYDDLFSIQFFKKNLRPYWRRNGDDAMALLRRSIDQFDDLNHRSLAFDAELMADLARVGGMNYANLSALAYRQCVAGNKVAADSRGQPLMFPKENSSSGLASTVDVIYPSSPQFLLLSPSLTKAMLIPVLGYASSYRWPWSFAPHDLGRYPIVGGQSYGGGEHSEQTQMPIEETANCLLLLGALAQAEGNASFADPYWPLIQKWAGYLRQKGFDPEEQICSDDFKGPLAHNANLSVKAICALGAFAQLCQFRGDATSATEWREAAKNFARRWIEAASDGDHFRLAFDRPGTWSQKYNLVWDRLLGLDLFPDSVRRQEMDFYKTRQNRYGLPLDGRDSFTKADWTLWSATLTGNRQDFDALFAPLYRFFSETTNRVPLADWCLTEAPLPRSFRARPVVGAFFLPLLYDRPIWKKWAARDATHAKDWAPILPPPRVLTIMPTADEEALSWHFSLNAPPSGWMNPDFNASAWPEGQGGFGTNGLPAAIMRTLWNGPDIWLRREVNLAPLSGHELRFRLYRSAEVQIYLNGVLAKSLPAGPNQYEVVTIRAAARSTIKPGKNVLAVHARPGSSGQFFDLGLVDLAPAD